MRPMTMLPDRVHFIGGCGRAMSGVMAAVAGLGVRVPGRMMRTRMGQQDTG
jgi:hypothetical protein